VRCCATPEAGRRVSCSFPSPCSDADGSATSVLPPLILTVSSTHRGADRWAWLRRRTLSAFAQGKVSKVVEFRLWDLTTRRGTSASDGFLHFRDERLLPYCTDCILLSISRVALWIFGLFSNDEAFRDCLRAISRGHVVDFVESLR